MMIKAKRVLGLLVASTLAACERPATAPDSSGQLTLTRAADSGDETITLIPPGFERAAGGPAYLVHVSADIFATVDPIARNLVFMDGGGKPRGAATLPDGFDVIDIDIGPSIVLRGDSQAVVIPRSGNIPAQLQAVTLPAPSTTVAREGSSLRISYAGREGRGSLTIAPRPGAQVVAATFLGTDQAGHAYVYWQESAGQRTEAWAGRFKSDGKLQAGSLLDLSAFVHIPALPVAVTEAGTLLMMRPTAASIELVEIRLEQGRAQAEEEPVGRAPANVVNLGESLSRVEDARDELERTGSPPPPHDPAFAQVALSRGRTFLDARWTLRPANFEQPGIRHNCAPAQGRYWIRPARLTLGHVGKIVSALPYKWGGFDSVDQFQRKMSSAQPSLAGDICTCRDPRYNSCLVARAAGVDCSGFVSRAWGLGSHTGTSALGSISARLVKITDLKPGDALNRPGNHVRLFIRFEPGPQLKIRTLESAVSCGGVCERVYTPVELQNYRPIRLRRN